MPYLRGAPIAFPALFILTLCTAAGRRRAAAFLGAITWQLETPRVHRVGWRRCAPRPRAWTGAPL